MLLSNHEVYKKCLTYKKTSLKLYFQAKRFIGFPNSRKHCVWKSNEALALVSEIQYKNNLGHYEREELLKNACAASEKLSGSRLLLFKRAFHAFPFVMRCAVLTIKQFSTSSLGPYSPSLEKSLDLSPMHMP